MNTAMNTVLCLAAIGLAGWGIGEGLGYLFDWALNVEEGSL